VPANADPASQILEAFYGTCLSYGPSFERTKAAAMAFKWNPMSPEMLTMFAPLQTPERFEGWFTGEGFPPKTAVAVTTGKLDGRPIRTCTMAVAGVSGKLVEDLFLARLSPRMIGEKSDGMQVGRVYKLVTGLSEAEQTVSVTFTTVGPEPLVVLSSMVDDR
jgi:hypothetical protein